MQNKLNIYEMDDSKDALHFESERLDEYISFFNKHPGKYAVCISEVLDYDLDNIDFITELNGVTDVSLSLYDVDYSIIYRLPELDSLYFGELAYPLDMLQLPNVRSLAGEWSSKLKNLDKADNLRELKLWKYKPKSKNLSELTSMKQLEFLQLVHGSVATLSHIENLSQLKNLALHYMRSLNDISSFANTSIEQLTISHCRKVSDFESISAITNLKKLNLDSVAPMPNLDFIHNLNELKRFSFCGAELIDGQLDTALEHPTLEQLFFHDKKHFSHKYDDFKVLLNSKRNS